MGGLFRAPKPQVVAAPQPTAQQLPPPAPDPGVAAEAARIEARNRATRGRAGTIATSERGVLSPLPVAVRKTLLGE